MKKQQQVPITSNLAMMEHLPKVQPENQVGIFPSDPLSSSFERNRVLKLHRILKACQGESRHAARLLESAMICSLEQ